MSLTRAAVARSRFTLAAAVALLLTGLAVLAGFPATEEPTVPFRSATVEAYLPGASPERMAQLVAKPLEESARTLAEVDKIETVIRPGAVILTVSLQPGLKGELVPQVWQRLRARGQDAAAGFPQGVIGPVVNDAWGRVSVMTLALTGPGYSSGQLQQQARLTRLRLQGAPGVEQVSLHGVREEQIYVELEPARIAAAGLTPEAIAKALIDRNTVAPGGDVDVSGMALTIDANSQLRDVAALAAVPIALPTGGSIPLGSVARIEQRPQDPPSAAVMFNGHEAVVLGVSMRPGLNVVEFARDLRATVAQAEADLPAGMRLTAVTDQAEVVAHNLLKVGKIFLETVVIVLGVVVIFLGWRAGLVTSVIVPLTVLGSMLVMRVLGIELHQISIAAIIIALGIFVDNAIVVVEDYERRLHAGQDRQGAAIDAGRTMAAPLLISSLAIILAFAPLVAGSSPTAEYMRSLAIVLAVTLLLSLFLALTVIALLAQLYIAHPHGGDGREDWVDRLRRWYGDRITTVIAHPGRVSLAMAALLAAAAVGNTLLPQGLLAPSDRAQIQIPIELAPNASSRTTLALAQALSARIADRRLFPDVTSNAVYVGDGGPRFVLGLNPPLPAPHRAYAVVNLRSGADIDRAVERLRQDLGAHFPEARVEPKRFSLGVSEAGKAVFILTGPDAQRLDAAAGRIKAALRQVPGAYDIRDDAETLAPRLVIDVDDARAAAAGVTPADIAHGLQQAYGGVTVTALTRGELSTPVVMRAEPSLRLSPEAIGASRLGPTVTLADVATIRIADQETVLNRRNQLPAITVTARHDRLTAQALTDRIADTLDRLDLPPGHTLALGGEIQEADEANAGLVHFLPLALVGMAGLFLWHFGSLRKAAIVMASIPFVLIGATLGLFVTGQEMNFTAILGLLALGGIIVNNAVLLLARVGEEVAAGRSHREAIILAAETRLRPIVMTKLTCIVGLIPLFAFGGALWRPMAAAMIGGLALGTLITLVLIPSLYILLFERSPGARTPVTETAP